MLYCTPVSLHWEPGPRYLNNSLSIGSQMKSHSSLPVFFLSPPRDATKLSQLHKQSGNPDQHCRPLSTKFGGPCCPGHQSFHVESILLMVIQVNKSYKNWSSIGKCCVIVENSKQHKHSYLVEYWHITTLHSNDVRHDHLHCHIMMWCSDDIIFFLAWNPCAYVHTLEWQFLLRVCQLVCLCSPYSHGD